MNNIEKNITSISNKFAFTTKNCNLQVNNYIINKLTSAIM